MAGLLARIHALDEAVFRRAARASWPPLDTGLRRLTHAADHGKLWFGVAGLLAATGTRRGRRAALRGLLALAAGSAMANVPAKFSVRRRRPSLVDFPLARQLRQQPRSTSFPSGHAASAAAFATGVALELPAAAVPVGVTAALVGYSRVHTGVHYPGDVLAGAALGAGMAVATRRFWPVAPRTAAASRTAPARIDVPPDADGANVTIAVNPDAGPAYGGDPTGGLAARLPAAEVVPVHDPAELDRVLVAAARRGRVIGVGGGDGSVSAAAAVAYAHDRPLVVVPSGTLNHFARDLDLTSADDAVDALQAGSAVRVSVARIADRTFVNTASFGAYPALVDARERLESRIGKWPALLVALVSVLRHGRPADVEVDGRHTRLWLIFIGNGRYEPDGLAPSWRCRLDDDVLDVRIVHADEPWARLRLVTAVLTGRLGRCSAYERRYVPSMHVRSLDGPLRLACDGETFDGPAEFTVAVCERRLAVFTPA